MPAERGRGGAEDDGAGLAETAHDGDVAGVVARRLVLLVAGLVLLVHDDDAEFVDGREDGRARADDDARLASMDAVPFVVALAVAELAVEDGDGGAEAGGEALDGLGGEGDFGDENDGAAPFVERVGDALEEDLGLAARGDAVEEHGRRAPAGVGFVHGGADEGLGGGLFVGERQWKEGRMRRPAMGIPAFGLLGDRDEAVLPSLRTVPWRRATAAEGGEGDGPERARMSRIRACGGPGAPAGVGSTPDAEAHLNWRRLGEPEREHGAQAQLDRREVIRGHPGGEAEYGRESQAGRRRSRGRA